MSWGICMKRPSNQIIGRLPKAQRCTRIEMLPSRSYATIQPSKSSQDAHFLPECSIYLSTSTSPYYNLSLEDWLFRRTRQDKPLLFLYRNESCVIIGRNQNPWKEINHPALRAAAIPFIRRRSGGGTVYHDLGNTNFSLHLPREQFDRRRGSDLVLKALQGLGVKEAHVNERNDVCVDKWKVSGSAYKIINTRAYHHGTMLISAELNRLGNVLRNTKGDNLVGRGVPSVRSPVKNIQDFAPYVNHDIFINAVVKEFSQEFGVDETVCIVDENKMRENDYISFGVEELSTWQWKYGQTLDFRHILSGEFEEGMVTADIHSKHGLVLSCKLSFSPDTVGAPWPNKHLWEKMATELAGERYGFIDGMLWREDPHGGLEERLRWKFAEWLRAEM